MLLTLLDHDSISESHDETEESTKTSVTEEMSDDVCEKSEEEDIGEI